MYEYVSKAEYKPYKEEIESIIKKVQKIMKTEYDTTFQFKLIGSAKRHLVTKIKDGNRGYDFDYNLILQKSDLWDNPKKLKVQGNEQLLHLAMANIINNGCKYSNFQQVNLTPGSIFQKFKVVCVRQVIQITSLFSTLKKVFLTAYNLIQ